MPSPSPFVPIKVYFSPVCPYAQRVTMALCECAAIAGIAPGQHGESRVELVEIDLRNKPADFVQKVNPAGTVPVMTLTQGGKQLTLLESAPIARFVLRHYGSALVANISDLEEYRANYFVDAFAQPFTSAFYPLLRTGAPEHADKLREIIAKTDRLLAANQDAAGVAGKGGDIFATGGKFGLADVLCAPFLARFPVLTKYRNFSVPTGPEYEHFNKWVAACSKHPSVKASTAPESVLIAGYSHMVPDAPK